MELQTENSLNYLDLTLTNCNNKIDFNIFHKPTHTDMVIHNSSAHPFPQKLASFRCYIHRLLMIPLKQDDFQKELNFIKQIAVNNGYSEELIDNLLHKKRQKMALQLVFPIQNINKKHFSISYIGQPSTEIRKFSYFNNLQIAFKTNNSLGTYIRNNKTKTDPSLKSGVYKLQCGSCPKLYIGQTGRTFKDTIQEHRRSFIKEDKISKYSTHIIEEPHTPNFDYTILHVESKGLRLNALESLEINRHKNNSNLLNDQLDLNNSPLLNINFG